MLFLTLGFQDAQPNFSYNITMKNVSEEKTLGITIDNKLTLKSHLNFFFFTFISLRSLFSLSVQK